jgi:UDP-glucose 4-epimerase
VTNSTGSIIPLIKDSILNQYELNLFSEEMTRFMLSVDDSINLIFESITNFSHITVVPNAKSFKVKDLFDIYKDRFGLKYKITSPRVGEKIHEVMINKEEVLRTCQFDKYFIISPTQASDEPVNFIDKEFSSRDYTMSISDLENILAEHKFYL